MSNLFGSGGLYFPPQWLGVQSGAISTAQMHQQATLGPIDAAAEKIAFIGRVYIAGGAASKVIGTVGPSTIALQLSTTTWADPASILGVGIQDVATTAGPPIRPDGVFDVSTTITGSTVPLTGGTWTSFNMTSGAKTISNGELYAVVLDLSARGSVDGLNVMAFGIQTAGGAPSPLPTANNFVAAWTNPPIRSPICMISADDGTLAWFDGSLAPISGITTHSLSSGGANTEKGLRFALPFTCQIDSLGVWFRQAGSTADCTILLYATPDTTPATVTAITLLGDVAVAANLSYGSTIPLGAAITLTSSTTYFLALRADTTGPIAIYTDDLASAAYKAVWPSGSTLALGARGGGAGAFSMVETSIPQGFCVRISNISSAGTVTVTTTTTITTAAGMLVHPSMTGGFRG